METYFHAYKRTLTLNPNTNNLSNLLDAIIGLQRADWVVHQ